MREKQSRQKLTAPLVPAQPEGTRKKNFYSLVGVLLLLHLLLPRQRPRVDQLRPEVRVHGLRPLLPELGVGLQNPADELRVREAEELEAALEGAEDLEVDGAAGLLAEELAQPRVVPVGRVGGVGLDLDPVAAGVHPDGGDIPAYERKG